MKNIWVVAFSIPLLCFLPLMAKSQSLIRDSEGKPLFELPQHKNMIELSSKNLSLFIPFYLKKKDSIYDTQFYYLKDNSANENNSSNAGLLIPKDTVFTVRKFQSFYCRLNIIENAGEMVRFTNSIDNWRGSKLIVGYQNGFKSVKNISRLKNIYTTFSVSGSYSINRHSLSVKGEESVMKFILSPGVDLGVNLFSKNNFTISANFGYEYKFLTSTAKEYFTFDSLNLINNKIKSKKSEGYIVDSLDPRTHNLRLGLNLCLYTLGFPSNNIKNDKKYFIFPSISYVHNNISQNAITSNEVGVSISLWENNFRKHNTPKNGKDNEKEFVFKSSCSLGVNLFRDNKSFSDIIFFTGSLVFGRDKERKKKIKED